MKRKKQTEEDVGEEESSAILNGVQSGHESPSDSQEVEMEDSLAGTPSKKRFAQPGSRVKASKSDENGDKEQLREPRSSTTPRPKISRELVRLQWESEGVKVSKARTSSVEKARPQLYEDSQQRDPRSAGTLSKADNILDVAVNTPTKRTLGDTVGANKSRSNLATPSKSVQGKRLFSTPAHNGHSRTNGTPRIPRNADRSARRKTTKTLIERTILGSTSDNDENEQDILEHIYGSDADDHEGDQGEGSEIPVTPSKKRGRAKREPSPLPSNLPPHELYFAQNRGRTQTSNNNLSSLALLDHEEYFSLIRNFKEPHAEDIDFLMDTHAASFDQWQFELTQDFNICIFGWGSKRSLLNRFAEHVYNTQEDSIKNKIVIVNGYVPNLTIRDVLNTVAGAISKSGQKLGSQPAEMLENIMSLLDQDSSQHITVIINSIDRAPLRRPTTQTILSRLSSHPQISLIASADHPSFPLLWDTSLRSTYNFIFHDCTTFHSYTAEVDVVDEVHELLGRSGRRVGGKEGVSFVLKSLPENAKNLFRVLIGEQLIAMEESSGINDNDNDDDDREAGNLGRSEPGVEYRVLYQKAVEEFICSNEMNFRTLLKEFHDHQMIQSRKDALGTEFLSVPFRKEELETILEDIM